MTHFSAIWLVSYLFIIYLPLILVSLLTCSNCYSLLQAAATLKHLLIIVLDKRPSVKYFLALSEL